MKLAPRPIPVVAAVVASVVATVDINRIELGIPSENSNSVKGNGIPVTFVVKLRSMVCPFPVNHG